MGVCTLVRRDVSACEWGGMLAGTLVYHHGPTTGGSRTVSAGFAGPVSVGAFLPLCPRPMLGPATRASKSRYKIIDTIGSHQQSVK